MTEVIGRGSFGVVSKGKCKLTGRNVALKVMTKKTTTIYDLTKIIREIQLMRKCNDITSSFQQ